MVEQPRDADQVQQLGRPLLADDAALFDGLGQRVENPGLLREALARSPRGLSPRPVVDGLPALARARPTA